MFWIGFLVGIIIGEATGMFIFSILNVDKKLDEDDSDED